MLDGAALTTAARLCDMLCDRLGILKSSFRLYRAGRPLDDAVPLATLGISSDSSVELKLRGRGGAAREGLRNADRALSRGEQALNLFNEGLSVTEVVLKFASAVPLLGPACNVAKDILAEVRKGADKVDDVLEAGRRVIDTLKMLQVMADNLHRLGEGDRKKLKELMQELNGMLFDVKDVVACVGSHGFLKRAMRIGKHAKTLKSLDAKIRHTLELAMNLYRFAQDASAAETQQLLLELVKERFYKLEEAVASKVDERVKVGARTEEDAISELSKDVDALHEVAQEAGISADILSDELREFSEEVREQYRVVKKHLQRIDAKIDALHRLPPNALEQYEFVRKPTAKSTVHDKRAAILGKGSFGTTYQMRKRGSVAQVLVAVKIIDDENFADDDDDAHTKISPERLEREAVQLSLIRHPHVVQFIDAFWHESREDGRQFVIVTELLTGGTFTRRALGPTAPADSQLMQWMGEIASGLACLHDSRLSHR